MRNCPALRAELVAAAAGAATALLVLAAAVILREATMPEPAPSDQQPLVPAVLLAADPNPWPDTVDAYTRLWAALPEDQWAGGDVSLSRVLPDGRVLWLYGDTFSTGRMVHSSAIIQDGDQLHVSRQGAQVLPDTGDRIYWIEDAKVTAAGRVRVTAAPMLLGDGGVWDFRRARPESRVAVVTVDQAGDVTFRRWAGYVAAPEPFNDFTVVGPHHFTYEQRAHPWAQLRNGEVLHTVNQNWDDGFDAHRRPDGSLRLSDWAPTFLSLPAAGRT